MDEKDELGLPSVRVLLRVEGQMRPLQHERRVQGEQHCVRRKREVDQQRNGGSAWESNLYRSFSPTPRGRTPNADFRGVQAGSPSPPFAPDLAHVSRSR